MVDDDDQSRRNTSAFHMHVSESHACMSYIVLKTLGEGRERVLLKIYVLAKWQF